MDTVLTVNGGSSSLKCALYRQPASGSNGAVERLYTLKLGNILAEATVSITGPDNTRIAAPALDLSSHGREERHQAALEFVLGWLRDQLPEARLTAVGHRVVHGGARFHQPVLLDDTILQQLDAFVALAPLHQPYNLKLIRACETLAPGLPQIACFDTMFHAEQPEEERNYAIPRQYTEAGIRRYGFHGLSYEYIQRRLEALEAGQLNTIICHLGAGASMCAVKTGRSIASTMGFTAVDGLPMGSRCGNIDPGVLLYLQRHYGMDADRLESLLNKESGWLGVSGISADMLTLHRANDPRAEEAINMFAYRIALELGRLSAALQGLQQIVFTGGVGENDADLRRRVLERAQWLGATMDPQANEAGQGLISTTGSAVQVRVIPTDEEAMIATHVQEVLDAH